MPTPVVCLDPGHSSQPAVVGFAGTGVAGGGVDACPASTLTGGADVVGVDAATNVFVTSAW